MSLFAQVMNTNQTMAHLTPLVLAISIVYSATRYESWGAILSHTVKAAIVILVLMTIILAIIAGFQFDVRVAYAVIIGGLLLMFLILPRKKL